MEKPAVIWQETAEVADDGDSEGEETKGELCNSNKNLRRGTNIETSTTRRRVSLKHNLKPQNNSLSHDGYIMTLRQTTQVSTLNGLG